MKRRTLLLGLATILLGLLGITAYFLTTFEDTAVDPTWALRGEPEIEAGAVTVRYTGTSTLLFSDAETKWRVDGWFSRFGPLEVAFGKIAPHPDAIARGLAAAPIWGGGVRLTLEFLKQQESRDPRIRFSTPPGFDEVVLF